jgi:hypothetical protein
VNAPIHPRSRRLQQLRHAVWMAPVAAIGLALGIQLPAAAGGVVPTIPAPPVPVPPVSVPVVDVPQLLPTTTSTTTTDPGTPTATPSTGVAAAGTQAAGGAAPAVSKGTSAVAGIVVLRSGAVSIPVSSVRPPARVLVSVSLQPTTVRRAGQPIQARVQVTDSRGFVVRGARVRIGSVPAGRLAGLGQKVSAFDGQVAFRLAGPAGSASRGSLLLVVSAVDPTAPKLAAALRSIRLAIRIGRS